MNDPLTTKPDPGNCDHCGAKLTWSAVCGQYCAASGAHNPIYDRNTQSGPYPAGCE